MLPFGAMQSAEVNWIAATHDALKNAAIVLPSTPLDLPRRRNNTLIIAARTLANVDIAVKDHVPNIWNQRIVAPAESAVVVRANTVRASTNVGLVDAAFAFRLARVPSVIAGRAPTLAEWSACFSFFSCYSSQPRMKFSVSALLPPPMR